MGIILLCGEIITLLEFVSLRLVKSENLAQSENAAFDLGLRGYRRHLYVGIKRMTFREEVNGNKE